MLIMMLSNTRSFARVILYILAISMLMSAGGCSTKISDRAITNIAVADASRKHTGGTDILFVDARSAAEFQERRIRGAIHVDLRDFDPAAPPAVFRRAKEIVVYGNDPGSATAIALTKRLIKAEFKRVYFLRDGLNGWVARSLPTEP